MSDSQKILSSLETLTQTVSDLSQAVSDLKVGQDELKSGQRDANRRLANLELCYTDIQANIIKIQEKQAKDSETLEQVHVLVRVLDSEHTEYHHKFEKLKVALC